MRGNDYIFRVNTIICTVITLKGIGVDCIGLGIVYIFIAVRVRDLSVTVLAWRLTPKIMLMKSSTFVM